MNTTSNVIDTNRLKLIFVVTLPSRNKISSKIYSNYYLICLFFLQVIVPAPSRLCCYHTIQIINLKLTIPLPYVFIIYLFIYCLVFIIIIYLLFITYYYKVLFYSYLIELLFVEYVATDPIVRGRQ